MPGRAWITAAVFLGVVFPVSAADLSAEALRLMRYWYGTIWSQDFSPETDGDVTVDLTCDRQPDRVFAWRDGVNPEGDYFQVALISTRPGSPDQGWEKLPGAGSGLRPLTLNIGTREQYALCDNRQEPYGSGYRTTVVPIPAGARERFGLPAACINWLRIDDGMCDAIHVGYDPAKGMFVLDRN